MILNSNYLGIHAMRIELNLGKTQQNIVCLSGIPDAAETATLFSQ